MCDIAALNIILAREKSIALTTRAKNLQARARDLREAEAILKSRAWEREHERKIPAFDFSENNRRVLEETHVFNIILNAHGNKRADISSQESKFCDWLGDRPLHISDLAAGADYFAEYFKSFSDADSEFRLLPLDNAICTRMMRSAIGYMIGLVELEEDLRHAFLVSKAIGAEVPATVLEILNSNEQYLEMIRAQLFSDQYAQIIESIATDHQKAELAEELLKLLYPKKWSEYLAQTDTGFDERNRAREEEGQWKEKFASARISTDFSIRKIREFMKLSEGDIEKAVEFAKLSESGLFSADIFMLMRIDASASERKAHASANKLLGINGLCHESIRAAVRSLDATQREEFPDMIEQYAGWLRLMPDRIPYDSRQELAAMLAFSVEPPQNPKEVYQLLVQNSQKIYDQNRRMNHDFPSALLAYSDYEAIMLRVSLGKEKMQPKEFVPPHEEIYFSAELRWFIGERKVEPEDVRRMVVYGLRLASQKSMREGKYIATSAFRDTLAVLQEGDRDAGIRAEDVELLLRQEGVIIYNKDKSLVRLNVNGKDDSAKAPTPMGKEILRMTGTWMADLYPPPEEARVQMEVGAALSEVHITDQEERAAAAKLASLTEEFRNASGREGKINALRALEEIGERASDVFFEGLNDHDPQVRAASLIRLADAAPRKAVVISIMKLIGDDPLVQETAAEALGRIRAQRGVWPLVTRLERGEEPVRINCARALGIIGAPAAIGALENAALNDESDVVKAEAVIALATIKKELG